MTPAETTTILRQYREWLCDTPKSVRPHTRQINEAIDAAVEMIDRLEAAEKERDALRAALTDLLNASACRPHSELHDILSASALAIRARGEA